MQLASTSLDCTQTSILQFKRLILARCINTYFPMGISALRHNQSGQSAGNADARFEAASWQRLASIERSRLRRPGGHSETAFQNTWDGMGLARSLCRCGRSANHAFPGSRWLRLIRAATAATLSSDWGIIVSERPLKLLVVMLNCPTLCRTFCGAGLPKLINNVGR